MTKLQMIESVNTLVGETPKLNKAFKESLESLLNDYKSSSNKKDEIAQIIEIDGDRYAWCNKHEIYEITDNFRKGKSPREFQVLCKAAESELKAITKLIHVQDLIMLDDDVTPELAFEALKEKKSLDVQRKGKYSIDSRPDEVKEYDYESRMIALGESLEG